MIDSEFAHGYQQIHFCVGLDIAYTVYYRLYCIGKIVKSNMNHVSKTSIDAEFYADS